MSSVSATSTWPPPPPGAGASVRFFSWTEANSTFPPAAALQPAPMLFATHSVAS